jgi:hypothetical protein
VPGRLVRAVVVIAMQLSLPFAVSRSRDTQAMCRHFDEAVEQKAPRCKLGKGGVEPAVSATFP